MEITVNVDKVDLDTVIAGQVRDYDGDGEYVGSHQETIGDAVVRKVAADLCRESKHEMQGRVVQIRDAEIRAQVAPLITAAVESGIQMTNRYGEAVGGTTTLRELIVKEANAFLTKPHDQYGRSGERVIDRLIRDAIQQEIAGELSKAIAEEKAKVVAAVRAKAAELIAQAVKEGIGR
jgi:hypothetical protein